MISISNKVFRWHKVGNPLICEGGKLAGSQIAFAKLSAHGPAFCASRTLRGPQNARECAKRHVRGTRAECVGRGSIARAALSARAVIERSGEWAALSAHFPRTCHAMPTQCNRGSTRVGHAEPQSPGTLRVNNDTADICTSETDYIAHHYWLSKWYVQIAILSTNLGYSASQLMLHHH